MIIFGSNSSHLKSEHLTEVACPHCNESDCVDISVFGKYAHVFWIPVFPMGKSGASQCQHCKQTLKEKEMPQTFKSAFSTFKSQLKTPFWHFSGLLIIALFVGWMAFAGSKNKKDNQAFINSPQVGDVYEYKTEGDYYSLMKVTEVSSQEIVFVTNKFEVARSSKLYTIDKAENFLEEEYQISRQDLQDLYLNGDIVDVNR